MAPDQPAEDRSVDDSRSTTNSDWHQIYPHSFIIRIWLEEIARGAGRAIWRGHITHVPSGERRYLKTLSDINTFIVPYLQAMGVAFDWRLGFKRWLTRWLSF